MSKLKKNPDYHVISCGVLITDGNNLLLGKVTGSSAWDIPKGMGMDDEDFKTTAIRETQEETGVILDPNNMTYLGIFPYKSYKSVAIFLYPVTTMPDINVMTCTSMFDAKNGKKSPEINGYGIFAIKDALTKVRSDMVKTLKLALKLNS